MDDREEALPLKQVPRYYTNSVRLVAGTLDLSIDLGYDGVDVEVERLARIVLSWEEARVLHRLLGQSIEDYATEIGPVRDVLGEEPIKGEELDDHRS